MPESPLACGGKRSAKSYGFGACIRPLFISRPQSAFAFALTLLTLALAPAARADSTPAPRGRIVSDGANEMEVLLPSGHFDGYAFVPVKLLVVNEGNTAVAWKVHLCFRDSFYGDRLLNPQGHYETIEVAPGRTLERSVLVATGYPDPAGRSSAYNFRITTPSGWSEEWRDYPCNLYYSPQDMPSYLVGQSAAALVATDGTRSLASYSSFPRILAPATAPGDWRGYTQHSVIVLDAADWADLPQAARSALGIWTRFGGHLQFLDAAPADAPAPDLPGHHARGLGGVHTHPIKDGPLHQIRILPAISAARSSPPPSTQATGARDNVLHWIPTGRREPVRDRLKVWPIVAVLIGFFVMVTPVNLFLLAPARRRYRLFFTIPAISLTACVLLMIVALAGDGIGGRGARLVWVEIEPGAEYRQFVTQWQASQCGVLPGSNFTVPDAAYVAPVMVPETDVRLRVGEDHLVGGGGWFASRSSQAHFLQAARPGRGHLEWITLDPENPAAVSTFDFPLRDIHVMAADGRWWFAPAMERGRPTAFRQVGEDAARSALTSICKNMPQGTAMHAMGRRPGHFVALTDTPPAIPTLRSIRWHDLGVVTGALAAMGEPEGSAMGNPPSAPSSQTP